MVPLCGTRTNPLMRLKMSRTIIALDVDGVLNANKAGWGRAPTHKHVLDSTLTSYRLSFEWQCITALRDIHTSGLAEIVWSTTWCPDALLLEALWGLPELRRGWDERPEGGYVGDLKLKVARDILAEGNRLVWIDDMEVPLSGPLYEELMSTGRALLIQPQPSRGLRPDDIADIKKFCQGNK